MRLLHLPPGQVRGGGVNHDANGIQKVTLDKLVDSQDFLLNTEELLRHCLTGCQPKQGEPSVFKAIAKFAAEAGQLIYKGEGKEKEKGQKQWLGGRTAKFAAVERDLWAEVQKYGVEADPHLEETKDLQRSPGGKKTPQPV